MMTAQPQVSPAPYHAYCAPQLFQLGASPSSYHQQSFSTTDNSTIDQPEITQLSNAYMNPILPQPAPQHPFQSPSRHGVKRSAPDPEDELERSSHISTQFKKLRLNNQHQDQSNRDQDHTQTYQNTAPSHLQPTSHGKFPDLTPHATGRTMPSSDFMTVDDTPHKIYIPDLDSEIADIEASERSSSQLFLPDFEKQIGAIPDHVLRSNRAAYIHGDAGEGSSRNSQALVLYREPSSISVPEEEDAVRKAILEARRGIRERMRRGQQRERESARVYGSERRRGSGLPEYRPDLLTETTDNGGESVVEVGMHAPDEEDAMDLE